MQFTIAITALIAAVAQAHQTISHDHTKTLAPVTRTAEATATRTESQVITPTEYLTIPTVVSVATELHSTTKVVTAHLQKTVEAYAEETYTPEAVVYTIPTRYFHESYTSTATEYSISTVAPHTIYETPAMVTLLSTSIREVAAPTSTVYNEQVVATSTVTRTTEIPAGATWDVATESIVHSGAAPIVAGVVGLVGAVIALC